MMASFLNGLVRPRLQLLVLMLILGTGLLPKNSMAEDGEGAEVPASDGASDGTGSADAVGRAEKSIKCWEQAKCDSDQKGVSVDQCLRKPTKEVDCETGYCYHDIQHGLRNGKNRFAEVQRGCLEVPAQKSCYTVYPKNCIRTDLTNSKDQAKSAKLEKCLEANNRAKGKAKGRSSSDQDDSGEGIFCICQGNLCNDEIPPTTKSAGVKHLGWNVALVGALLVSIFPLRSTFLVG